jgi:hypothetical protein
VIRFLAATVALLGIVVGCGGQKPSADQAPTKVFELADYPFERAGWIGTGSSIREIDPDTLQPRTRKGLRLGGYSGPLVFSPDRSKAAFGINFGELVVVDLREMRLIDRLRLGTHDLIVRPVGWPRPDLLFALGCNDMGKYGCGDNRLLLIDPTGPRQVASFDLGGSAEARYDAASRRSVIFVSPGRIRPARLLIAEPTGAVREVELTRILVGTSDRRFGPHLRSAAFALEGGRAIVIGTRGVIAEVPLSSRMVRYHRVPELSGSRVNLGRVRSEAWTGTVNPMSDERVLATRFWPRSFLVTSARSKLGHRGTTVRRSAHTWLLDTATWSARQWRGGYVKRAADVVITSKSAQPYRGPTTLLAHDRSGAIRYRLTFPGPVTYSTYGNRLYVGRIDGRKTSVYDARTGRLLHRMRPTDVEPAFSWTPPD